MLYEEYETKISQSNLSRVVAELPAPVCLLGGWAVYYTVNSRYHADTGTSYHGSKDIDLGFHIEPDATVESLRKSALAKAIDALKGMEFRSVGIRLFKEYHRETHVVLAEAKAKKTPTYNIFHLYVDLLVDNAPGCIKKAIGLTPIDEKLLTNVFDGRMFRAIDELHARVILPDPALLLAMKATSLPSRTKDHKKHKDIMDIYALIWYSGVPIKTLRQSVAGLISGDGMARMLSSISGPDYKQAADALGVDREGLENVIKNFVRGGATVKQNKERWTIPRNMSYDRLIMTVKALHRARADQKAVGLEKISKTIGVSADSARRGLAFLRSTGIVELTGQKQYSLTAVGVSYAEAHSNDDDGQISECTRDIIKRSHLKMLEDAIEINKNMTREDLYKRIKTFGRLPNGKDIGNMHGPDATGATTILRLFEDAGLLREDTRAPAAKGAEGGHHAAVGTSKPRGGKRPARAGRGVPGGGGGGQAHVDRSATAGGGEIDDLAVLTVRGVGLVQVNDLETLRMAEAGLDMVRKRLQGKPRDEAGRSDAARSQS